MQVQGFFSSLFDFSFSSFITGRIIKVLYVLTTIVVALWTLLVVLLAFRSSTTLGILALLIGGPIFFVFTMIYVRVVLELIMVIFRIHEDVDSINRRGAGSAAAAFVAQASTDGAPVDVAQPEPVLVAAEPGPAAPEPPPAEPPAQRFCDGCGAERSAGKGFCTACGKAFA